MKQLRKENLQDAGKKLLAYFVLYAFLPLLCCGAVALLAMIRQNGTEVTQTVFQQWGEESIAAVVGADILREEPEIGFYFLSGEIPLLLTQNVPAFSGGASYYKPVKAETPSQTKPVPEKYYSEIPAGATAIIKSDLSSSAFFRNTTKYEIDIEKARNSAFPSGLSTQNGEPLVLVLHAHGTECYFEDKTNLADLAPEGVESYFVQGETLFRTADPTRSVVQVGKVFSDTLNALGIPTIHCTVMHDKDDYNNAYTLSAETVKAYLKEYPSIQYVVDLHRDSVVRGDEWVKTHAQIEGKNSAQVMLVVGTNQNGRHPNWEQNLIVATAFQDSMYENYPSLARPMYLRTARFNQEYLPGCMLLEVGSAANTLEEAEEAARLAADAFSRMIRSQR